MATALLFAIDDYKTNFTYDLTENRLSRTTITDSNNDGVFDAAAVRDDVITFVRDKNDRMQSESKVVDGVTADNTVYSDNQTQRTAKTVHAGTATDNFTRTSQQIFTCNLQGRKSNVVSPT